MPSKMLDISGRFPSEPGVVEGVICTLLHAQRTANNSVLRQRMHTQHSPDVPNRGEGDLSALDCLRRSDRRAICSIMTAPPHTCVIALFNP